MAEPAIEDALIESGTEEEVVFEMLDPVTQTGVLVEQRVENFVGTLDAKIFPGILVFRSNDRKRCTATLVGPRALFTAAHCLNGGTYSIRLGVVRIGMKCYYSKEYNVVVEYSNDWALCLLDQAVPIDKVSVFETLDVGTRPEPGKTTVMLTGYGCTVPDGPSSIALLYGFAPTVNRPVGVAREDTAFFTRASVGDPAKGAILCPGDSGGPAFITGPSGPADNPRIIGVNSRSRSDYGISWFSATASNMGIRFFKSWISAFNTPICGLDFQGQVYDLDCR